MKRRYLLVLFALFLFVFSSSYSQDFNSIYSLYKQKDYFRFRNNIGYYNPYSSSWQKPFLESMSDCIFGNFEKSNRNIDYIISNYISDIPDSLLKDIYQKKYFNHSFLHEYKYAYESALIVLEKYTPYLNAEENQTLPDDIMMFKALVDSPPQKITKGSQDANIKISKDMAGLWRMPVKVENFDFNFVFDTGADFSVIVESLAKKLGMKISDEEFNVGTSTDKKIKSKIAVANSVIIGTVLLENVVFYVMKDEDFTFGPYKIEGIVGAPIMRDLGEIRISQKNELTICVNPEDKGIRNFAYDQYTPIIQMVYSSDSLNFVFDSGNNSIMLFTPFLKKYENDITSKYKLTKIGLGGAGGIIETDGYILDEITLSSGNSIASMKKVNLLLKPLSDTQKFFHGNLGQAFIGQFETLILNYKNMYIEFRK
ncbi:MAG: retropepsin-like domain-containing protein [Ignavibacteriae bacterium]|nr:retropepsin-like domain-containing protein [Ignavibacteriota bacterium]